MASATAAGQRAANPFDSDVEDDALDPSHFGEDDYDDEEGIDMVDFRGIHIRKAKPKKKDSAAKLHGQAQPVTGMEEDVKASTEVIGHQWEAEETAATSSSSAPVMSVRLRPKSSNSPAADVRASQGRPTPAPSSQPERTQKVPVADFGPLPIKETVRRIVLGKPFILEYYHKRQEKELLLKEVIKTHDGNAILTVLLFLRRTLSEDRFLIVLLSYEVALKHFYSYLQQIGDFKQLEQLYAICEVRKAGLLMYKRDCLSKQDPSLRLKGLDKCIRYFETFSELSRDVKHLEEQRTLLRDIQIPMQQHDDMAESKGYQVFVQFPRTVSVTSASLMSTLFYSCLYHFTASEAAHAPDRLKKDFKLTEHQYIWMAVAARAKARDYKSIDEKLLTVTGWFGRKNQKAVIGFEKVSEILRQFRAPEDEVIKYMRKVDDPTIRLAMAYKLDCQTVVIETLKEKRDRVALSQYRERLPLHTAARREVDQLLINSMIKWKN